MLNNISNRKRVCVIVLWHPTKFPKTQTHIYRPKSLKKGANLKFFHLQAVAALLCCALGFHAKCLVVFGTIAKTIGISHKPFDRYLLAQYCVSFGFCCQSQHEVFCDFTQIKQLPIFGCELLRHIHIIASMVMQ